MDLNKESLEQQFKIVKRETNTSHVMQYGDLVCCFYNYSSGYIFISVIACLDLFHSQIALRIVLLYQVNGTS